MIKGCEIRIDPYSGEQVEVSSECDGYFIDLVESFRFSDRDELRGVLLVACNQVPSGGMIS